MSDKIDGLADIIAPVPAHEGLAALLAPSSSLTGGGWLLILALVLVVALLLAAFLLRHALLARFRLWQAERALHCAKPESEIAARIAQILRKHYQINILHPAQPPNHLVGNVDGEAWRHLIEALHATQFGGKMLDLPTIQALLRQELIVPTPTYQPTEKPPAKASARSNPH